MVLSSCILWSGRKMSLFVITMIAISTIPLLSAAHGLSRYSSGGAIKGIHDDLCRGVPHPTACSSAMEEYSSSLLPRTRSDAEFLGLSIHAAHDRVRNILLRLRTSRPSSHRAWDDCIVFYDNAASQLRRTSQVLEDVSGSRYSVSDTQTWLSAALTNVDMCRTGLASIGVSLGIPERWEERRAAQLISNCLAINWRSSSADVMVRSNHPSWTSSESRWRAQVDEADAIVTKDGTGNYDSIAEAVAAVARSKKQGRKVIYIKRGLYRENLYIPADLADLALISEGMGRTKITGNRSLKDGYSLVTSATLAAFGDRFVLRDLTVQNTYRNGSQAVALLVAGDQSAVHRCRIDGYQDSLCTYSQRQFYRDCQVLGAVDFIFGNAVAVLQNCSIYPRLPLPGQSDPITAQGRTNQLQNTGIVIHRSVIRPWADLYRAPRKAQVYLGRPWKEYSRTIYMQNYTHRIVQPSGWLEWSGDFALVPRCHSESIGLVTISSSDPPSCSTSPLPISSTAEHGFPPQGHRLSEAYEPLHRNS